MRRNYRKIKKKEGEERDDKEIRIVARIKRPEGLKRFLKIKFKVQKAT